MALTDTKLRSARPNKKRYKLFDDDGLYAEVLPTGSIAFRFQYYAGRDKKILTIGPYPGMTLQMARKQRDELRDLQRSGIDPKRQIETRRAEHDTRRARNRTFREFTDVWLVETAAGKATRWNNARRRYLERDAYPALGKMLISEIKPADVLALIRNIASDQQPEDRAAPTSAERLRTILVQVFDHAIRLLLIDSNPARPLAGAVTVPPTVSHRPLEVAEIGPFLRMLDATPCREQTRLAAKLLMLTLVRKDELRLAKWAEFDLDGGVWEIPAHRMKMRDPHRVYLSRQAIEILRQLREISAGSEYVLPNRSSFSRPMGYTTFNSLVDRIDIQGARFVPHGFRSTASTLLHEQGWNSDVIERALAHRDGRKARAIYNKAEYADQRRELLQHWADYLDGLRAGGSVISLRRAKNA